VSRWKRDLRAESRVFFVSIPFSGELNLFIAYLLYFSEIMVHLQEVELRLNSFVILDFFMFPKGR